MEQRGKGLPGVGKQLSNGPRTSPQSLESKRREGPDESSASKCNVRGLRGRESEGRGRIYNLRMSEDGWSGSGGERAATRGISREKSSGLGV